MNYNTSQDKSYYDPQFVLEKAIEKAIDGGCHEAHDYTVINGHIYDLDNQRTDDLIYWHDFAKALWGETDTTPEQMYGGSNRHTVNWKWHLAEMVIAPDPIKYLGENI